MVGCDSFALLRTKYLSLADIAVSSFVSKQTSSFLLLTLLNNTSYTFMKIITMIHLFLSSLSSCSGDKSDDSSLDASLCRCPFISTIMLLFISTITAIITTITILSPSLFLNSILVLIWALTSKPTQSL